MDVAATIVQTFTYMSYMLRESVKCQESICIRLGQNFYGKFFSDLGLGDEKNKSKSTENDQLTGHFQSFFFF